MLLYNNSLPAPINNGDYFLLLYKVVRLQTWDDDMITTGFTGSDFPTFGWTNVYSYDETLTGASTNGFVAPTNVTDAIGVGEGFMLYLGGSGDTIFDVTGAVNTGTVNLNLDFTSTPSAADDGWNLIGNPLPSAVDFGSLTTANIDNKYYITDPATGNSAVWDEDLTLGTLGADGDIGQSQGFWVQTTALSASIAFPESAKTADANLFFSKKTHPPLYISLYVSNKLYDETIVRSDENASNDLVLTIPENYGAETLHYQHCQLSQVMHKNWRSIPLGDWKKTQSFQLY